MGTFNPKIIFGDIVLYRPSAFIAPRSRCVCARARASATARRLPRASVSERAPIFSVFIVAVSVCVGGCGGWLSAWGMPERGHVYDYRTGRGELRFLGVSDKLLSRS
jgi:ferric-dicitrate binding protein FerR (iron transport regulator)